MTHGLTAEQLLLDREDPVVFEMLRDEFFDEFAPATSYEEQLTHWLASLIWRLRRVAGFEVAILKWMNYSQAEIHDSETHATAAPRSSVIHYGRHKGLAIADDQDAGPTRDQLRLGRMLEAAINKNLTAKLGHLEAHLMRQLKATRMELADHQAARAERESAALEYDADEKFTSSDLVPDDLADLVELDGNAEGKAASEPVGD